MYGEWVVHPCSASTGWLRQEDEAFKACPGYIGRPHLNKKTNKQIRAEKEKEEERGKKLLQKISPKNWGEFKHHLWISIKQSLNP